MLSARLVKFIQTEMWTANKSKITQSNHVKTNTCKVYRAGNNISPNTIEKGLVVNGPI